MKQRANSCSLLKQNMRLQPRLFFPSDLRVSPSACVHSIGANASIIGDKWSLLEFHGSETINKC